MRRVIWLRSRSFPHLLRLSDKLLAVGYQKTTTIAGPLQGTEQGPGSLTDHGIRNFAGVTNSQEHGYGPIAAAYYQFAKLLILLRIDINLRFLIQSGLRHSKAFLARRVQFNMASLVCFDRVQQFAPS